jgi:septation ring formation regulator EzrA
MWMLIIAIGVVIALIVAFAIFARVNISALLTGVSV